MSKNFDLIATVDIDIASPIVDTASFDNLLILGPAPKGEHKAPDVGVYATLEEVKDAGFIVSGENADPVGVAARIAFSQSPMPSAVYVALQKHSAAAVVAQETIATMNAALQKHTAAYEKVGCSVAVDYEARDIVVTLTVPFAKADGHGLFQALDEFVKQGYSATIDGITVENYAQFKQTKYDAQLLAMKKGDSPIGFTMMMVKEDYEPLPYHITVAYPDPDVEEDVNNTSLSLLADSAEVAPEDELEPIGDAVSRALGMSGWYVLCPAGVDPALYEEMAGLIEAERKMMCYAFFTADPLVGEAYFRTMGIFGGEFMDQPEAKIPEGNRYINVAFAAKWLNYESGSETAAFKELASVYPAELTGTQLKQLKDNALNYFIKVGSKNISMNGMVRAGEWADVIRFRDWLQSDMQLSVVNLFVTNPKVPFTDNGISLVENQMRASLKRGQNSGGIAEDEFDEDGNTIPGFVTSVPRSASIPAAEKKQRVLKRCKFKARLAGAIHFAEITGSLTYEL